MNRGLVLGIDGLDFGFVNAHLDSLPAIRSMTEQGTWGKLESTIPPLTAPAWTTALSGINPGKTGITNFLQRTPDDDSDYLIDSTDVRVPRLWDVSESLGEPSVVLGAPITFPASPLDGGMITGLRTPELGDGAVSPPELADEIPDEYDFFISYNDFAPSESDELLDRLYTSTDAKFDFLERVLSGEVSSLPSDPTLVTFVLSESDWIQHYFLKHPEHPKYESGSETVLEYFKHVDSRIGEVRSMVDTRTVGLLSDHGFGKRISKHVCVNELLIREGLLTLSGETSSARQFIGRNLRSVAKIPGFQYVKEFLPKGAKDRAISMTKLSDQEIDWDETVATFRMIGNNVGGIDIVDREGVEVDATKAHLMDRLSELRDPDDGSSAIRAVYDGDDLYDGPASDEAADVIFVFEAAYSGSEQTGVESIIQHIPEGGRPGVCHRPTGVYCLTGDRIRAGHRADIDLVDFAPTFYSALDVPLPERTDGTVLSDAFERTPDVGTRRYERNHTIGEADDDTELVRERLEGLGYL